MSRYYLDNLRPPISVLHMHMDRQLEAVDSLGFALEVAAFTNNLIVIIAPARLFILDYIVLTGVVADIRTYHLLPVLNA